MLNGQPVKQQTLDNMRKAMEFTHPDTEALWKNEKAGIGSMIRFVAPESFKEKQPIFFEDDQKVMVVAARIDNRDELCPIFGIPLIYRDNYPDSHYVRLAFEKWGIEATGHLLGDWSFAVYDKSDQKLYVARDHCGITALYYYSCPDFFAFSSSPKGLLTLQEIPKEINEFRIAQILVAWPGDGEQTCYQHIFNLLPGHYLTIHNKQVQKHKYWELTEQENLILPKEQDYYDRFLEIFTEAVRCRLRTTKQVGISLSGGLDSTSIAAIAAIELAKQNKELFAFTSVPLYKNYKVPKGRNGDEGELAGLMPKMYPNIRHFLVNAEGYDPIECIKKAVEIYDEPMHAAVNQYWIQAINDKAKEYNCDILLNGQAGNATISWPTSKVKNYNQTGYNKYFKHVLRFTYNYLHDLILNHHVYKNPILKHSDINLNFAKKLGLNKESTNNVFRFNFNIPFKKAQNNLISQGLTNVYPLHFKKTIWNQVLSLDPTGDYRVIVYQVPFSVYKSNNLDRLLVKYCTGHLLPLQIKNSKSKGIQACDIEERITKSPSISDTLFLFNKWDSIIKNHKKSNSSNYLRFARNLSTIYFLEYIKP